MAGQLPSDCEIPIGWGIEEDVAKVIYLSEHCSILANGVIEVSSCRDSLRGSATSDPMS